MSGTAADNVGVTQVRWMSDRGEQRRSRRARTSWSVSGIPLFSGSNVITVTAARRSRQCGDRFPHRHLYGDDCRLPRRSRSYWIRERPLSGDRRSSRGRMHHGPASTSIGTACSSRTRPITAPTRTRSGTRGRSHTGSALSARRRAARIRRRCSSNTRP